MSLDNGGKPAIVLGDLSLARGIGSLLGLTICGRKWSFGIYVQMRNKEMEAHPYCSYEKIYPVRRNFPS